jgi:arylsulfatase
VSRPNVVLVTIDSLRADHCGHLGYEGETTPTLDEMAEEGLAFENTIAPGPNTPESMPVIFTGHFLQPYYTGDSDSPIVRRRENIREHMSRNPSIADALSRAGYTTIGFSPNPFTARHFGFHRGFDRYEDFLDSDARGLIGSVYRQIFERFLSGDTRLSPVRLVMNWFQNEEMFKSWDEYYDQVVEAAQSAEEPYFLWVFLLDSHLPYLVGSDQRHGVSWLDMWRHNLRLYAGETDAKMDNVGRETLISLYDATIRQVDRFVARLREDLTGTEPVFAVHADHGEAFGEHGTYGHEPYVYEENIRVPYVVWNADGYEGSVSRPVSLRTLPASIMSIAGVESPFPTPESVAAAGGYVPSNTAGSRVALRGQRWKYIRNDNAEDELYDLVSDPDENENALREHGDVAEVCRMWSGWQGRRAEEGLAITRAVDGILEGRQL